jgi:nitroreductase
MAIKSLSAARFVRGLWRILRGRPRIPALLEENALLRTILRRRSVRQFKPDAVPEDVFQAILEAGRLAPSTVNLQTWSFAVFDAAGWQQRFGCPLPFRGSRAVIVIADTCRDRQVLDAFPSSPLIEYTIGVMNASLAAMNMTIAAEALGVSSVMLSETGRSGLLDIVYLKDCLGLPERTVPLMTIVFGYPRGAVPPMPPKLPAEQIFFTGTYPQPDREGMQDWLDQMVAGYKASHIRSSFESQLEIYRSKIGQAEADLREIVFIDERKV